MSYTLIMTLQFVELFGMLIVVLLISAGVVLWLQSQKRKPHPLLQVFVLIMLLVVLIGGMKWGGDALGLVSPASSGDGANNAYLQALILLQEPYSTYTTANNLAGTNREALIERFQKMERLEIGTVKPLVRSLQTMIENAPSSGQQGMYNMRMTSDIQARWDALRVELAKRAEQKP